MNLALPDFAHQRTDLGRADINAEYYTFHNIYPYPILIRLSAARHVIGPYFIAHADICWRYGPFS